MGFILAFWTFGIYVGCLFTLSHAASKDVCPCDVKNGEGRMKDAIKASPNQFKFMVSIWVKGYFACSGILISPADVLTVAHCVARFDKKRNCLKLTPPHDISVYINDHNLVKFNEKHTFHRYVENVSIHYDYVQFRNHHDIAIIRLSKPLNEEDLKVVSLACILSDVQESLTLATEEVIGIGYGKENVENTLSYGLMIVQDYHFCEQIIYFVDQTYICASPDPATRTVICSGDSGGPIAKMYNGVLKMVGIASFIITETSCADSQPMFYTQLTSHLSWILSFSEIPHLCYNDYQSWPVDKEHFRAKSQNPSYTVCGAQRISARLMLILMIKFIFQTMNA